MIMKGRVPPSAAWRPYYGIMAVSHATTETTDTLTFEGLGEFAPLAPASKKDWEAVRKAWDATQPMLGTSADRVAVCDGKPFVVGGGSCTVATIANGQIK